MLKRIINHKGKLPREHHYIGAAIVLTLVAIVFVSLSGQADASREFETAPTQATPATVPSTEEFMRYTTQIRQGDSVFDIFQRLDLDTQPLNTIMADRTMRRTFRNIKAGQSMHIFGDANSKAVSRIEYEKDDDTLLVVTLENGNFVTNELPREYETRVRSTSGVIESSLFESAKHAGMSESLIMELAGIFGWDIDFALDIRKGDSYSLIYEEHFRNGEKFRDGAILAARFTNGERTFYAIRHVDNKGRSTYYSPNGRSIRKAFLRSPVDFRRISSRFGNRYHPIHRKMKRHTGVDYAARAGTPIRAAGDGKIIFRGRKGGYGRTIIIKHGNVYSTLYAHMRAFARGTGYGRKVRQGQIIGYVGQSGTATGPHLHYEFRVHGVHRNPLTVRLPDAAPIPKQFRDDFQKVAQQRMAQLNLLDRYNRALYVVREQQTLISQRGN
jgi:murein DD-endopeptidase MepM/ murein hydrolase activator NlpD